MVVPNNILYLVADYMVNKPYTLQVRGLMYKCHFEGVHGNVFMTEVLNVNRTETREAFVCK